MLVYGPLATGAVRPQDFLVIQGLAVLVGFLCWLRFWINPEYRWRFPPICWAVLLFAGYAVARYLTADIEYLARKELVKVLVYTLVFFVWMNQLELQKGADLIVLTLVFLAFWNSIYALYQFLNNTNAVWHFIRPGNYGGRGSGTYICPNHLAGYLAMILPVGLAYVLVGNLKKAITIGLGYATLGIAAGIYATLSRGGMVAATIGLCLFFLLLLRQRAYQFWALLLFGAIVLAGLLAELNTGYFQKRFRGFESESPTSEVAVRLMMWLPAVQIWQEHFWWGAGPAHFDSLFPAYRPPPLQARPDRVHNDYLNTLADWGVVGASLVTVTWLLFFLSISRYWRAAYPVVGQLGIKRNNRNAFILGSAAGLFAILLHSAVDFNMHVPANAMLAVTLLAIATGLLQNERKRSVAPGWIGKLCATLIFSLLLTYLGTQLWVGTNEWIWLERADQARQDARKKIAALEHAYQAEPKNFETAYALGELYRGLSWQGLDGYQAQAKQAMQWYERSRILNPYHAYSWMRYGMCLDWLGRHAEGGPYFKRAVALDPNGYYTAAHQGWHYFQLKEWAKAKAWFEQSLYLSSWQYNPIARFYFHFVDTKLIAPPSPKTN